MTPQPQAPNELGLIAGLGAVGGALAFLVHGALTQRPWLPIYEPPTHPVAELAQAPVALPSAEGEVLYGAKCAACHQADGRGLPGAFPPLAGSSWLVQDSETPIRIALLGLSGPIEVSGVKFEGAMPNLGLSNAELAQILSYVRSAWGNSAGAVQEADVARVRTSLNGRNEAWDAEALRALRSAP
jgi:mono/diheme cytochrome c family protein